MNDLAWSERQLVLETRRRKRAEARYADLLAGIAKAVVLELRAAKFIEIHENPPTEPKAGDTE